MEKIQENKLYKPGEVSQYVGIGTDLLRKYSDFFNIQTEWTQEPGKGHRRYSHENIQELLAIKEKIQDQNWSWDKVLAWRNGEEDPYFKSQEEKSNLEKKIDRVLDNQERDEEFRENQMQFNQMMFKEFEKVVAELKEVKTENEALKSYIDQKLETRDQLLLESIKDSLEQRKETAAQEKKKKRFFLF